MSGENRKIAESYLSTAVEAFNRGEISLAIEETKSALLLGDACPAFANYLIGVAYLRSGNFIQAAGSIQKFLETQPNEPDAHERLAIAFRHLGEMENAALELCRTISLSPDRSDPYAELGQIANRSSPPFCIELMKKAYLLNPKKVVHIVNLGVGLLNAGYNADALHMLTNAWGFAPSFPNLCYNLGNSLFRSGAYHDAAFRQTEAICLTPQDQECYVGLGASLHRIGQIISAKYALRCAQTLSPDDPIAIVNDGMLNLLLGEFEQGWKKAEFRWMIPDHNLAALPGKPWNGDLTHSQKLLVLSEQGLGDTLQFSRYLRILTDIGMYVTVCVPPTLKRLIKQSFAEVEIIENTQTFQNFDSCISLLSLPKIFRTVLNNIPRDCPYLFPAPTLILEWNQRLGRGKKLRVGIAWSGNPKFKGDRERSMTLGQVAPLLEIENIEWHVIQKDIRPDDRRCLETMPQIYKHHLDDMADTAALCSNLDLIVTTDTSIAHLAGGMGRPCWVMLSLVPDWRWLLGREDSPWYPTMRLFRQSTFGDWSTVVSHVVQECRLLAANYKHDGA